MTDPMLEEIDRGAGVIRWLFALIFLLCIVLGGYSVYAYVHPPQIPEAVKARNVEMGRLNQEITRYERALADPDPIPVRTPEERAEALRVLNNLMRQRQELIEASDEP